MWKRSILSAEHSKPVVDALQTVLTDLIDLGLVAKQAHWNVYGPNFEAVHEKLDVVVELARTHGDEVAERIVKLGYAADGRKGTVAEKSNLAEYPSGFESVGSTLSLVCDRLNTVVSDLRAAREVVAEHDAITEDLLIGVSSEIETQFWMLQAMEGIDPS